MLRKYEAKTFGFKTACFDKKKRSGKIKGRIVADRIKQRRYIKKEDVGSPTVHLESFLTTLVIDTYKGRDVEILDVGGAFLLSKIAEFVLVKIDGDMLKVISDANPRYKNFIVKEHGKNVCTYA